MLGRESMFTAIVEPRRKDALLGAIVLRELDLIVDEARRKVIPRFSEGIMSEIEQHAVGCRCARVLIPANWHSWQALSRHERDTISVC